MLVLNLPFKALMFLTLMRPSDRKSGSAGMPRPISYAVALFLLSLHDALPIFGAIAGGIASALAGGAMSKLFGGGQKAASGGIQGDVLATDNNTVGMGDAGIKSAIQGSNVPNPDEAVPSFVSGAMA